MLPFLNELLLFLLQLTPVLITYHSQHFSAFKKTNIPPTNFQTTPTSQILIRAYFMDTSYLRSFDKYFYQCKNIPELIFHQKLTNKAANYFFKKSHPRNSTKLSILHQLYYKSVNRALSYIIIIHTNQIIITQSILVKFYFLSQLSTIDLTSIRPPSTFSQLKKISTNITNMLLNLFLSIYPLIILINKNFTEQVIHKKSSSNFFIKSLIPFQKSYKSVSISLTYIIIYLHHQEISIRTIPTKFHILPSELTNDHSPSQHLMKLSQHRNLLANIINSLFHLLLLLSPCRTSINTKLPNTFLQDSQDQDTNHPTQLIPPLQDCMMFICFACFAFLTAFINLIYESNFCFNLLTYYSYCSYSTITSIRHTMNTLALDNTDLEHHWTTHATNTTYTPIKFLSDPTHSTESPNLHFLRIDEPSHQLTLEQLTYYTTYLQPHYTLINFLYNLLQLTITYNTNLIFTQLNRLSYFLTLNFPIYLLKFSLSTTTNSFFFSYHIDNSTLKLTNNRLSVLLLLSLDTILLSLSRRTTTQHRVAQHTQLNRLSYFLTLNFPIYLLKFSLSTTTTISFFSYHIDNSTLKLTNNRLSVLLLSLDTILLSLSRRTTQHRVAQHPIADTTNTYTHATIRVCLRRRTIYLWMVPHPTANTTNTYRNTQEIILITSTRIQSETLTMTHFSASTSTTHTTNPVHSTFGPAYSSDNAGDGPPSKRPASV